MNKALKASSLALSFASLAAAIAAPEAEAARQRLIQKGELLLRESGTTNPLEAATCVDRSGTTER